MYKTSFCIFSDLHSSAFILRSNATYSNYNVLNMPLRYVKKRSTVVMDARNI